MELRQHRIPDTWPMVTYLLTLLKIVLVYGLASAAEVVQPALGQDGG